MLKCQTCGQWMGHIQCLQGRPKECSVCASVPAETNNHSTIQPNNHSTIQPNNHSTTVNCPAPTSLTLKVKMRTPQILLHRLTRQDLARATRRQSRRLISKALKNEAKASTSVHVHPPPMDRRQSSRLNPNALKNEAKASTSVHVHPSPMDRRQSSRLNPNALKNEAKASTSVHVHPPPMGHHQAMDLGPVLPHHQAMDLGPVLSHPPPMGHHQAMNLGPVLPHHQAMNLGPVLPHHQAMDLGPVLSHPPRVDTVPGPYIVKVPLHMMYYPHLMSGSMVCNSVSSWSGGQCQWIVKQDTHNEFRFCFSRIYS